LKGIRSRSNNNPLNSQEVTSSPPLLVYSPVPYPPASPSPFSSEPPFNYPSPWGLAQAMVQNISQPADQNLVYGMYDSQQTVIV